jgi:hypothetical protein
LVESKCFVFFNKIRYVPSQNKVFVSTLAILFYETNLDQQTVGIPMGTNCGPLLADLFFYSYAADFIKGLLKKNEKKLARSFNFTFLYH